MNGESRWLGAESALANTQIGGPFKADPVKVEEWLKGADQFQCKWMMKYLWNQFSSDSPNFYMGNWSLCQLGGLVDWMLSGDGLEYGGLSFPLPLMEMRKNGAHHFAKARNAWNQRVNRQRKAEQAASTIKVDPNTKRKITKLASEHNLKEDEFLSILIDLMSERRGAVEGVLRQRKAAKKAAIASDFGLFDTPTDSGGGSSL